MFFYFWFQSSSWSMKVEQGLRKIRFLKPLWFQQPVKKNVLNGNWILPLCWMSRSRITPESLTIRIHGSCSNLQLIELIYIILKHSRLFQSEYPFLETPSPKTSKIQTRTCLAFKTVRLELCPQANPKTEQLFPSNRASFSPKRSLFFPIHGASFSQKPSQFFPKTKPVFPKDRTRFSPKTEPVCPKKRSLFFPNTETVFFFSQTEPVFPQTRSQFFLVCKTTRHGALLHVNMLHQDLHLSTCNMRSALTS